MMTECNFKMYTRITNKPVCNLQQTQLNEFECPEEDNCILFQTYKHIMKG